MKAQVLLLCNKAPLVESETVDSWSEGNVRPPHSWSKNYALLLYCLTHYVGVLRFTLLLPHSLMHHRETDSTGPFASWLPENSSEWEDLADTWRVAGGEKHSTLLLLSRAAFLRAGTSPLGLCLWEGTRLQKSQCSPHSSRNAGQQHCSHRSASPSSSSHCC